VASIAENKDGGIWQLSARSDVTYEMIAAKIAALNRLDSSLIMPVSCKDAGSLDHIPTHTTLDATRAKDAFGFDLDEPLDAVLSI
jgi:hypothetical protein